VLSMQLVIMDQAGRAAEATCQLTDTLAGVLELAAAQLHQGTGLLAPLARALIDL